MQYFHIIMFRLAIVFIVRHGPDEQITQIIFFNQSESTVLVGLQDGPGAELQKSHSQRNKGGRIRMHGWIESGPSLQACIKHNRGHTVNEILGVDGSGRSRGSERAAYLKLKMGILITPWTTPWDLGPQHSEDMGLGGKKPIRGAQ